MSHPQQIEFCKKIKSLFPDFFNYKLVLDVGSLDINGNNRYLFDSCTYLGIDIADGNNVDIVSLGGKLQLPDESFDTIISTECLEHDMYYPETLSNMYRMLKPGGLLILTCATEGRAEHGTMRTTPEDAPLLQVSAKWSNYYQNLTEADIREVWPIEDYFKLADFEINSESHDLYFYGFKQGIFVPRNSKSYYVNKEINEIVTENNNQLRIRNEIIAEKEAIISHQELATIKITALLAEKEATISKQELFIIEKNSLLAEMEATISKQELSIIEKNSLLAEMEATISKQELSIIEKNSLLAEMEATISKQELSIIEKNSLLAEMEATISKQELSIIEKNSLLAEMEATVTDQDAAINAKDALLGERDEALAEKNRIIFDQTNLMTEICKIFQARATLHKKWTKLRSMLLFKGAKSETDAVKICSGSTFFNSEWYLNKYPDVRKAGVDPILHYIAFGAKELRDPGPNFSTLVYLISNPKLIKTDVNPLVHFEKALNSNKKNTLEFTSKDPYHKWIKLHDTLSDEDIKIIKNEIKVLKKKPLISIIMPVYNTPEKWLQFAIDSVLNQLYPCWELCIADDASTAPHVKAILRHYANKDPRIKITYREKNGHISAASNSALELATGEFISLLDHDDEIPVHALFKVAEEINAYPDAALIYSDEDKIDIRQMRSDPYFKSDWNPDLIYGHNFISHLGTYRRSIVTQIKGFREGYEGSQDYDLALRVIEKIKPDQIRHIPHVLYHWRAIPGSLATTVKSKTYAHTAARRAIQSHLNRLGLTGATVTENAIEPTYHRVIYSMPNELPMVSIIIPTKDKINFLKQCVESVLNNTEYPNFELIIIDNNSVENETFNFYKQIVGNNRIKIIPYNIPFNFSKINNFAVKQANGEIITFLNNDTEVITPNWLAEMVSHAIRPEIGVVGAKLYYPDNTIQHAGVIGGLGSDMGKCVANHIFSGLTKDSGGYIGKALLTQNFLAVTAACMAMRRNVFEELGGFEEKYLAVAFNDVDLCLRAFKNGYRILWTPYAELYHHESATRGLPKKITEQIQFQIENQYMHDNWCYLLQNDPFYNPNLSLSGPAHCSLAFPPRHKSRQREYSGSLYE